MWAVNRFLAEDLWKRCPKCAPPALTACFRLSVAPPCRTLDMVAKKLAALWRTQFTFVGIEPLLTWWCIGQLCIAALVCRVTQRATPERLVENLQQQISRRTLIQMVGTFHEQFFNQCTCSMFHKYVCGDFRAWQAGRGESPPAIGCSWGWNLWGATKRGRSHADFIHVL